MGRRPAREGGVKGRPGGGAGLRVRLISIGKDRSGLFSPAVDAFAARLSHYCRLDLVELPEARSRAAEAEAILARVDPGDWLLPLDQRGKLLSSEELAQLVGRAQGQAHPLTLCIGGDEGLDPAVLERAHLVLSLSKMTLPHRLARVVVAEQLYRAFTILRGEPYHK